MEKCRYITGLTRGRSPHLALARRGNLGAQSTYGSQQRLERLDDRSGDTVQRWITNGAIRLGIDPHGRRIRRASTLLLLMTWVAMSLQVATADSPGPVGQGAHFALSTGLAFAVGLGWRSNRWAHRDVNQGSGGVPSR